LGLCNVVPGVEGGAARSNPGDLAGELGRGVAGEELGVERTRSGYSLAAKTGPVGGTAKTGGGGCGELCSGEPAARVGQQASVGAFVEQEEDRSGTVDRCKRPEHRFTVTPWASVMAAW
jgi:hypothetical protein